jgi:predicted dehydrogenase
MIRAFESIAIAGAWGYIGRKLLDAALRKGLRVYAFDPGPVPADLYSAAHTVNSSVTHVAGEAEFYELPADLFHLALQPDARREAQSILLERAQSEPLVILNEKPMAAPETPDECRRIVAAVDHSRALMLYDFLELFDPLTRHIIDYFAGFRRVEIESMAMERSKDREDPSIARNYKWMLPIQYQESVHCLAYVLYLMATLRGGFESALSDGLTVTARSEPYSPPNREAYSYVVDGRCEYRLTLGALAIEGLTNFKRGAPWSKRRVLRGHADGRPFVIEADYLEGKKYLRINGADQGWDAGASSYHAILTTFDAWRSNVPREDLLLGVFPNPRLAWLAFQMSSVLWKSSHAERTIKLADAAALEAFDSGFSRAHPAYPNYAAVEGAP